MSDYERKFDQAIAELENAGLQERGVMPSSLRFLRRIGCKPIPLYYRTTVSRFAYDPLIFGGLWGLGMFVVLDTPNCLIPMLVLGSAALGYTIAGLSEITILRQRRRQNLSRWDDL